MADPWTLAQQFIQNLQQENAAKQQVANQVRYRMLGAGIDREVAQDAQKFRTSERQDQNQFAEKVDTTQYNRQLTRDEAAAKAHQADRAESRQWQVGDREIATKQRRDNAVFDAQLAAEDNWAQGKYGYGTPPPRRYEQVTVDRESGGNNNAKNPNSSALGPHQILKGTWASIMKAHPELGLTVDGRTDPKQSSLGFNAFTNDNVRVLQSNGIEPTDANKYAAHFLGAGGAVSVLRRADNTPMSAAVSADTIAANPHLKSMTVGDFKRWTEKKYGSSTTSSSDTASTGPRRSAPEDDIGAYPEDSPIRSDILGLSSASGAANRELEPTEALAARLANDGLEVVGKRQFTSTELEFAKDGLPAGYKIVADPTDFSPRPKNAPAPFYVVKPIEGSNTGSGALPAGIGESRTTKAANIEVQKAPRYEYNNGKMTLEQKPVYLPD